ncbi:hypothetical protein MMC08_008532 [Hypocenomyce scalaris]|nr:hypothetical protein [Hypocenomyce scalaris]
MIDFDNQADLGLIPGNPQALIGGYLHWLQPGIQFSTTPLTPQPANANKTAIYIADAAQAPVVPYLAPQAGNSSKADGHRYVFLLWKELVAFSTPADFPYNNTFRLAFNATRVATDADVGTPLLADWFVYEANATVACKSEYPRPTGTGYSGKPSSYATGRPHWRS